MDTEYTFCCKNYLKISKNQIVFLRKLQKSCNFKLFPLQITINVLKNRNVTSAFFTCFFAFLIQQLSGVNIMIFNALTLFNVGGSGNLTGSEQTVLIGGVQILSCFLAIGLIDVVGRRTLLIVSSILMGLFLILLGKRFITMQWCRCHQRIIERMSSFLETSEYNYHEHKREQKNKQVCRKRNNCSSYVIIHFALTIVLSLQIVDNKKFFFLHALRARKLTKYLKNVLELIVSIKHMSSIVCICRMVLRIEKS